MTLAEFERSVVHFILSTEAPDLLQQAEQYSVKQRTSSGVGSFADFQLPDEIVKKLGDNRMLGTLAFAAEKHMEESLLPDLSGDYLRFVLLVDDGRISQLEMFQDGQSEMFPQEFSNLTLKYF